MTSTIGKLVYDAATELLTGRIGNHHFHDAALSGGARGHKQNVSAAKAARYLHANALNDSYGRLATTREVYDKQTDTYKQRGGSIPPGHYRCVYVANHPSFEECIRLDPSADAHYIYSPFSRAPIPHRRAGFYIHGHGPKGSDGCIVLVNESRRKALNSAVKGFVGHVQIEVVQVSYELPAERESSMREYQV
jgi:hypothetical protein